MSDQEQPGRFIQTNDPKDAIIARLMERTEWMMDEGKQTRRVIERLDQTLDHLSETMAAQAVALKELLKGQEDVVMLKRALAQQALQVANMEASVSFWSEVRDKIAFYAIGLVLVASAASVGLAKLAEQILK